LLLLLSVLPFFCFAHTFALLRSKKAQRERERERKRDGIRSADCSQNLVLLVFLFSSFFFTLFSLSLCPSTLLDAVREKKGENYRIKFQMWRDLPPDLANLVFEELDAPEDRAAFRMACRYCSSRWTRERTKREANVRV